MTHAKTRQAGYSLIEMMVAMGVMTVVMGATVASLDQATKMNNAAVLMTGVNNGLRTGMDLMIRDMLQIGSGLPTGHVVLIPSGTGAVQMNIPGPPSTAFLTPTGDVDWAAVIPGDGIGPTINGVATDTITMLMSDNNFVDMPLTAITNTTIDVAATHPGTGQAINIQTGVDRLQTGQLLMLEKGSATTLVQITSISYHEPPRHLRQRRLPEAQSDRCGRRKRRRAACRRSARHADQRCHPDDGDPGAHDQLLPRHVRAVAPAPRAAHQQRPSDDVQQRPRHGRGARHREPAVHLRPRRRRDRIPRTSHSWRPTTPRRVPAIRIPVRRCRFERSTW